MLKGEGCRVVTRSAWETELERKGVLKYFDRSRVLMDFAAKTIAV